MKTFLYNSRKLSPNQESKLFNVIINNIPNDVGL